MNFLRKILFPFAVLYGWITQIRNFMYDNGILKSYTFDVPVIVVGNLSVGGTGKTPQIECLIRLLSDKYKVAVLSRGYKRMSKGFILAKENATAKTIGDEPFQFYQKFKNIQVAVDADRCNGILQLLAQKECPEVILLDDAYQHRKVKAGFYILLTAYDDFFYNDFMLPMGNLREGRSGAKRADMIIVTKCPQTISELAQEKIKKKIGLNVPIFFSQIIYDENIFSETAHIKVEDIKKKHKVLLTGIAKPKSFFEYLQTSNDVILEFSDHHNFTEKEILQIKNKAKNNLIITTEKDYARLKDTSIANTLFYLPIKSSFISEQNNFDKTILNYVGKSTGNK